MIRPLLSRTAAGCAIVLLWGGGPGAAWAQAPKPYVGPAPTERTASNLYGAYCANCHGTAAHGDGPLAKRLAVGVPDLRRGMRLTSGADGVPFLVQDVMTVLHRGVPEAPMPPYAGLLTPQELQSIARLVARHGGVDESAAPLDLGPVPEPNQATVVEGGILYARAGCMLCHGLTGQGPPDARVPTRNLDGTPVRVPNLTQPVTWRGGGSARDIATRVARGMPGTPMPAYRPALKDREIWQVGQYVETLASVTSLAELARSWAAQPPPTAGPELAVRGEHLLRTLTCTYCHRAESLPRDLMERTLLPVDVGPLGVFTAGSFSTAAGMESSSRLKLAEDLRGAIKEGRGLDGRHLMPAVHPWPHFKDMSAHDVDALAEALSRLPRRPVQAPPPLHASWMEQLGGKFSAVSRLTITEARMGARVAPEDGPEPRWVAVLVMGCALGLTLLLTMLALGGPKRSRGRRTMLALIPLPVGAALGLLMVWPPYRALPNTAVASMLSAELPMPQLKGDEATQRVALKGRELVQAVPCALCHTAYNPYRLGGSSSPLGGGTRLRSKAFGRVFAGNLTPHASGLGSWTPEEIRRAIRGGVGKDGRVFHWEAMPYDHFGLLSDVELEAVVTYLRSIPEVSHVSPAPESWDDAEGVVMGLYDFGH